MKRKKENFDDKFKVGDLITVQGAAFNQWVEIIYISEELFIGKNAEGSELSYYKNDNYISYNDAPKPKFNKYFVINSDKNGFIFYGSSKEEIIKDFANKGDSKIQVFTIEECDKLGIKL